MEDCILPFMVRLLFMIVALSGLSAAQQHVTLKTQDGGVVQANVYGKGKRGIVLAHGGLLTKESWANQAQILAGARPGSYIIRVDYIEPPDLRFSARASIEITNSNVEGVTLTLSPGGEVQGSLRIEACRI